MKFFRRAVVFLATRSLARLPVWLLQQAIFRAVLNTEFSKLLDSAQVSGREGMWAFVIQTVGPSRRVLFLEFGVYKGRSIKFFASRFLAPESRFYGFDSFEGLPEDWSKKKAGAFSTSGQLPRAEDHRISFVKGWFQDTLPAFAFDASEFEAVLVHMDADLYSSTLFVLSVLWHRLRSFYVVFDEFSPDEARALHNFSQAFPVTIHFLAHDHDANPQRVFCKIERAESGFRGTGPGHA